MRARNREVRSMGFRSDCASQALVHEALKPAAAESLASIRSEMGTRFIPARLRGSTVGRPGPVITERFRRLGLGGERRRRHECHSAAGQHRDYKLSHEFLLFASVKGTSWWGHRVPHRKNGGAMPDRPLNSASGA